MSHRRARSAASLYGRATAADTDTRHPRRATPPRDTVIFRRLPMTTPPTPPPTLRASDARRHRRWHRDRLARHRARPRGPLPILAPVHPLLDADLALCPPRAIEDEWRLFVVDGRVVTGSHYRSGETLDVHDDVPSEVAAFGEGIAVRYTPSPAFVLDVARSRGTLKVVEYNCLHGAGFYASDVGAVVRALNDYVASTTS
ncbi:MAG: ATP-grasp domain-containing protein [Sandaracinus sp.]|nr:ATP-grasp domain-containing protein [Sandaracinus sp.]